VTLETFNGRISVANSSVRVRHDGGHRSDRPTNPPSDWTGCVIVRDAGRACTPLRAGVCRTANIATDAFRFTTTVGLRLCPRLTWNRTSPKIAFFYCKISRIAFTSLHIEARSGLSTHIVILFNSRFLYRAGIENPGRTNPKTEIRGPKEIRNPRFEPARSPIRISSFGLLSDFDVRPSDLFSFLPSELRQPA
jgi:hypothetical protein